LPDLLKAMRALKQKIQLAISDSFFGEETMQLLQNLDENGAHETRAKLEKTFKVIFWEYYKLKMMLMLITGILHKFSRIFKQMECPFGRIRRSCF
jgi:hypothetical protein